jgi:hypothetical protein
MSRGFWYENMKERNHLEDLNICGSIILNIMRGLELDLSDCVQESVAGSYRDTNNFFRLYKMRRVSSLIVEQEMFVERFLSS